MDKIIHKIKYMNWNSLAYNICYYNNVTERTGFNLTQTVLPTKPDDK